MERTIVIRWADRLLKAFWRIRIGGSDPEVLPGFALEMATYVSAVRRDLARWSYIRINHSIAIKISLKLYRSIAQKGFFWLPEGAEIKFPGTLNIDRTRCDNTRNKLST